MSTDREPFTVITLKDVYSLLTQVRDIVLAEQERRKSLTLQVKMLWGLNLMIAATIVTAFIRGFA